MLDFIGDIKNSLFSYTLGSEVVKSTMGWLSTVGKCLLVSGWAGAWHTASGHL